MVIYIYVISGTTEFRYSRNCFCTANDIHDHDILTCLHVHDYLITLCKVNLTKVLNYNKTIIVSYKESSVSFTFEMSP